MENDNYIFDFDGNSMSFAANQDASQLSVCTSNNYHTLTWNGFTNSGIDVGECKGKTAEALRTELVNQYQMMPNDTLITLIGSINYAQE